MDSILDIKIQNGSSPIKKYPSHIQRFPLQTSKTHNVATGYKYSEIIDELSWIMGSYSMKDYEEFKMSTFKPEIFDFNNYLYIESFSLLPTKHIVTRKAYDIWDVITEIGGTIRGLAFGGCLIIFPFAQILLNFEALNVLFDI